MKEITKIGFETVGANTILHDLTPKQKMNREIQNRKNSANFKQRITRQSRKRKA